eukprot:m.138170 g.138170  ORF g.138170 m.138170 type:complete len:437 (+) comp15909_c4_seq3:137-1447(+)
MRPSPFVVCMLISAVLCGYVHAADESTLESLQNNVLSYLVLVVPAALIVRYVRANPGVLSRMVLCGGPLRMCIFGEEDEPVNEETGKPEEISTKESARASNVDIEANTTGKQPDSVMKNAIRLGFCIIGLQGSYLTWGVLQELIMTRAYGYDEYGKEVRFRNSQYLVFINRVLALVASYIVIKVTTQPRHTAPLYRYSFASMSNIMSSWCQYEALKYVSFPTQVLAKSSKIIPVMLMGKYVQGKTYPVYEYVCAVILSIGVSLFLFSKASDEGKLDSEDQGNTSFMGMLLLIGYMMFDSFTSNFQDHLFSSFKMSSYQMMFGVNLFSCIFTLWSLIQHGTFFECVDFTLTHPDFLVQAVILSITSATGQMFIFYTLSTYGALVFAIIMTTRQVISIFVSALVFGHNFAAQAWFGIAVVFVALFGRMYLRTAGKGKK